MSTAETAVADQALDLAAQLVSFANRVNGHASEDSMQSEPVSADEALERLAALSGYWVVRKVRHDLNAPVGPIVHKGGWIARSAGTSDPEHTREYAAQLLAAADSAEFEAVTPR